MYCQPTKLLCTAALTVKMPATVSLCQLMIILSTKVSDWAPGRHRSTLYAYTDQTETNTMIAVSCALCEYLKTRPVKLTTCRTRTGTAFKNELDLEPHPEPPAGLIQLSNFHHLFCPLKQYSGLTPKYCHSSDQNNTAF